MQSAFWSAGWLAENTVADMQMWVSGRVGTPITVADTQRRAGWHADYCSWYADVGADWTLGSYPYHEALERMTKNDVKYRFMINIENSLKRHRGLPRNGGSNQLNILQNSVIMLKK
ncbi:unnamed protein product [Dovyalis caffra]|uniref:Uncharacterized protein n=1 Tax=Dovyalis caffra TaxID=77055 RepID=A0AAV1RRL9_9ROSI|nr:unnamed protein product [Dovyalis caffra]